MCGCLFEETFVLAVPGLAADAIEVGRTGGRVAARGGLIKSGTELGDGRTRDISIGSADDIGALDGEDRGGLVQRPGELHHGVGADDGNAGDIGPAQIYDLEVVEDHGAVGADGVIGIVVAYHDSAHLSSSVVGEAHDVGGVDVQGDHVANLGKLDLGPTESGAGARAPEAPGHGGDWKAAARVAAPRLATLVGS